METDKLIEALRTESRCKDKATLEIMDLCMIAADKLEELNDFEQTQCAKLLVKLAETDKQLAAAERFDDEEKATAAWNRRAPLSDNKALTAEELQGMDGEPVWIVAHPDWGHWELSERAEDYFEDRDEDFYGMTMPPDIPDPMGRYGLHMLGWLAYRRPPENAGFVPKLP